MKGLLSIITSSLFHYYPYGDVQQLERSTSTTTTILTTGSSFPFLLGGGGLGKDEGKGGGTSSTFHWIPLDIGFWITTFSLLMIQTLLNITVAIITYQFIIVRRASSPTTRYLIGYGILLPALLLGPPYFCTYLVQFDNLAILLCLVGAIPNMVVFKVIEATHGLLPDYTTSNLRMTMLYFSATLQLQFDPKTKQSIPFTREMFWNKLREFVMVFVQTSVLYSILVPRNYQLIPIPVPNDEGGGGGFVGMVISWFHWAHLINGYCMASLLSLVLEGGASGLGLLQSLITGYALERFSDSPLTKSTSPSDFWANRWDRPVQFTLRRGCYNPLLLHAKCSKRIAAILTFVVSGLIHEYMLWIMTMRRHHPSNADGSSSSSSGYSPSWGNQFFFFVWNAVVLTMERILLYHQNNSTFLKWIKKRYNTNLPQPIQTALVLLTVLPIAHLFTDEYIQSKFFDDLSWGFPRLEYHNHHPPA